MSKKNDKEWCCKNSHRNRHKAVKWQTIITVDWQTFGQWTDGNYGWMTDINCDPLSHLQKTIHYHKPTLLKFEYAVSSSIASQELSFTGHFSTRNNTLEPQKFPADNQSWYVYFSRSNFSLFFFLRHFTVAHCHT